MKQTAVEWYEIEINSLIEKYEAKEISEIEFITMKHNLFYKAKEMEEQQQGYSEEDIINLLESLVEHPTKPGYKRRDILKVIEQFKKK